MGSNGAGGVHAWVHYDRVRQTLHSARACADARRRMCRRSRAERFDEIGSRCRVREAVVAKFHTARRNVMARRSEGTSTGSVSIRASSEAELPRLSAVATTSLARPVSHCFAYHGTRSTLSVSSGERLAKRLAVEAAETFTASTATRFFT
eukprot:1920506-Pleurochrysis_carterae.AAC.1